MPPNHYLRRAGEVLSRSFTRRVFGEVAGPEGVPYHDKITDSQPIFYHQVSCFSCSLIPIDPAIQFSVVGRTSLRYDMNFKRQGKIYSVDIFPLLLNTSKPASAMKKYIYILFGCAKSSTRLLLSVEGKL
jgi:hypothetical protein